MRRIMIVALLAAVSSGARAGTQDRDGQVSVDLVQRLLAGYGGFGNVTIVEGLPPGFPEELIPDGATVRLGLRMAMGMVVLAEARDFDPAARPRYLRKLAAAGWAAPRQGRLARGLATSPAAPAEVFCLDGRHASYAVTPAPAGAWWVHVTVMRYGDRTTCDPSSGPGPMPSVFDDPRMPILAPPGEAQVTSMSGSMGDHHQEQEMRLSTRATPAAVVEHYASLLTAQGWKAGETASVEGISIARFSAPLGSGDSPLPAAITAMALQDGSVSVSLRVFVASGWGR